MDTCKHLITLEAPEWHHGTEEPARGVHTHWAEQSKQCKTRGKTSTKSQDLRQGSCSQPFPGQRIALQLQHKVKATSAFSVQPAHAGVTHEGSNRPSAATGTVHLTQPLPEAVRRTLTNSTTHRSDTTQAGNSGSQQTAYPQHLMNSTESWVYFSIQLETHQC